MSRSGGFALLLTAVFVAALPSAAQEGAAPREIITPEEMAELERDAQPVLECEPAELRAEVKRGRGAVLTLTIRNAGGRKLNWSVFSKPEWVRLDAEKGELGYHEERKLVVAVETAGLGPGTVTGELMIVAADAKGSPASVSVSVHVRRGEPPPPERPRAEPVVPVRPARDERRVYRIPSHPAPRTRPSPDFRRNAVAVEYLNMAQVSFPPFDFVSAVDQMDLSSNERYTVLFTYEWSASAGFFARAGLMRTGVEYGHDIIPSPGPSSTGGTSVWLMGPLIGCGYRTTVGRGGKVSVWGAADVSFLSSSHVEHDIPDVTYVISGNGQAFSLAAGLDVMMEKVRVGLAVGHYQELFPVEASYYIETDARELFGSFGPRKGLTVGLSLAYVW